MDINFISLFTAFILGTSSMAIAMKSDDSSKKDKKIKNNFKQIGGTLEESQWNTFYEQLQKIHSKIDDAKKLRGPEGHLSNIWNDIEHLDDEERKRYILRTFEPETLQEILDTEIRSAIRINPRALDNMNETGTVVTRSSPAAAATAGSPAESPAAEGEGGNAANDIKPLTKPQKDLIHKKKIFMETFAALSSYIYIYGNAGLEAQTPPNGIPISGPYTNKYHMIQAFHLTATRMYSKSQLNITKYRNIVIPYMHQIFNFNEYSRTMYGIKGLVILIYEAIMKKQPEISTTELLQKINELIPEYFPRPTNPEQRFWYDFYLKCERISVIFKKQSAMKLKSETITNNLDTFMKNLRKDVLDNFYNTHFIYRTEWLPLHGDAPAGVNLQTFQFLRWQSILESHLLCMGDFYLKRNTNQLSTDVDLPLFIHHFSWMTGPNTFCARFQNDVLQISDISKQYLGLWDDLRQKCLGNNLAQDRPYRRCDFHGMAGAIAQAANGYAAYNFTTGDHNTQPQFQLAREEGFRGRAQEYGPVVGPPPYEGGIMGPGHQNALLLNQNMLYSIYNYCISIKISGKTYEDQIENDKFYKLQELGKMSNDSYDCLYKYITSANVVNNYLAKGGVSEELRMYTFIRVASECIKDDVVNFTEDDFIELPQIIVDKFCKVDGDDLKNKAIIFSIGLYHYYKNSNKGEEALVDLVQTAIDNAADKLSIPPQIKSFVKNILTGCVRYARWIDNEAGPIHYCEQANIDAHIVHLFTPIINGIENYYTEDVKTKNIRKLEYVSFFLVLFSHKILNPVARYGVDPADAAAVNAAAIVPNARLTISVVQGNALDANLSRIPETIHGLDRRQIELTTLEVLTNVRLLNVGAAGAPAVNQYDEAKALINNKLEKILHALHGSIPICNLIQEVKL